MEDWMQMDDDAALSAGKEYLERMEIAYNLFDKTPFRLAKGEPSKPSESMYDAVMIAVDRLWKDKDKLLKSKAEVTKRYWEALDTPEKIEQFSGRANTAGDVKSRINAMTNLFSEAIRDAGFQIS